MAELDSGRIFISYRRADAAYPAGWLFDRLAQHFGAEQVFKDVDSIELGDDFAEDSARTRYLNEITAVAALPGSGIHTAKNSQGNTGSALQAYLSEVIGPVQLDAAGNLLVTAGRSRRNFGRNVTAGDYDQVASGGCAVVLATVVLTGPRRPAPSTASMTNGHIHIVAGNGASLGADGLGDGGPGPQA